MVHYEQTVRRERVVSLAWGPGAPEDDPMYGKLRSIYDDKKKIPHVAEAYTRPIFSST